MEEATRLARVMVRMNGVGSVVATLPEAENAIMQVFNQDGWITVSSGRYEDRTSEDGSTYRVYKAIKRITIPANLVLDITEEYEDQTIIS